MPPTNPPPLAISFNEPTRDQEPPFDIVAANRREEIWLDTGKGNAIYIPAGWSEHYSMYNGSTRGPDNKKKPEMHCIGPTEGIPNSPVDNIWVRVKVLKGWRRINWEEAILIHPNMELHIANEIAAGIRHRQ